MLEVVQSHKDGTNVMQKYSGQDGEMGKKATKNVVMELRQN
jgi:hypothetical protein